MKALLVTPNYQIPDLEAISGFSARNGEQFSIVLEGVPDGVDVFSNNDPSLAITFSGNPADTVTVSVKANAEGTTKVQVRTSDDVLLKAWIVKVFTEQATSLNGTFGEPRTRTA